MISARVDMTQMLYPKPSLAKAGYKASQEKQKTDPSSSEQSLMGFWGSPPPR